MRLSERVKPISYFKANASEILDNLVEPMAITKNGEVKAIVLDIRSYEEMRETLALLKILAMGMEEVRAGQTFDAREVFDELLKDLE